MNTFQFRGELPASKSILNRALIVQSYFPALDIIGDSQCDDVLYMKKALAKLRERTHVECGEGGTTLRFLTLRLARVKGMHSLDAHPRLMQRPQQELVEILKYLGVQAQIKGSGIGMVSDGWKKPRSIVPVHSSESSQYASALLLNSWLLDFDLEFSLAGDVVSESYFQMTYDLVTRLGMRIENQGDVFHIPAGQRISKLEYRAEPDLSSSFVFATAGALFGRAEILHFPELSVQPDQAFVEIFRKMNIHCRLQDNAFLVEKTKTLQPVEVNLGQSPDLFPVLAVLCSFAQGTSRLFGAPHLVSKESNRIRKVADLFELVQVKYEILPDGMVIHGKTHRPGSEPLVYDPAHDHRMVMAAGLFKQAGYPLRILNPEAVKKSLPEFFDLFGVQP
jgi:3-phosphoshikimate 1-carboxyvinyltransferase